VRIRPDPRRHVAAGVAGVALTVALALRPAAFEREQGAAGIEESLIVPREPREPETPLRPWHIVDGTQWQLDAPAANDMLPSYAAVAQEDAGSGNCPDGMVEARGAMKRDGPHGTVEDLQTRACSEWVDHPEPHSCNAFDPAKWAGLSRDLPTTPMDFCIDRYEYPDRAGQYPVIMVNWLEAKAHCAARGTRLCTEDEWTFACEGPEARPYANGYARDASACVIDRPWRLVDFPVFAARTGPRVEREIDSLWQGEPTGSHPRCVSPSGAYDMTGNVDEWTITSRPEGLRSILKGGYWGPVHARCRSSTRVHNEWFYFYQIGFRCCGDVAGPSVEADTGAAARPAPPPEEVR
jgi:formylglycine-generating enzyme